ncbi:MAG: hypothetical protein ACO24W_05975 [Candidatus Nanopelagicales bacterium]
MIIEATLPLRRIVTATLVLLIIALAFGVVLFLFDRELGYGILLGSSISMVFFLVTALVTLRSARLSAEKLAAMVLGSWLVKVIVLIAILVWLKDQDFYNRTGLFLALLVTTGITLVADALITLKTRVPYVN